MTIDAILQLYELAVSSADTLGERGTFQSDADFLAHEKATDEAMAEVERLQTLLIGTPAGQLPAIAAKLRLATDLARQDEADAMPEWLLVSSALRDLAALVSLSVTKLVQKAAS